MTTKFNVGDVVRLKSGGPEMTVFVTHEGSTRPIYCSWFNGATILHHGDDSKLTGFKPEMLDLVRAAATPSLDSPVPASIDVEPVLMGAAADLRRHFAEEDAKAAKQPDRLEAAIEKIVERSVLRFFARAAKEDTK